MKELMGGAWLAALIGAAMGCYLGAVILGITGALAGVASWEAEQLEAKQANSWRKNYPVYRY